MAGVAGMCAAGERSVAAASPKLILCAACVFGDAKEDTKVLTSCACWWWCGGGDATKEACAPYAVAQLRARTDGDANAIAGEPAAAAAGAS